MRMLMRESLNKNKDKSDRYDLLDYHVLELLYNRSLCIYKILEALVLLILFREL